VRPIRRPLAAVTGALLVVATVAAAATAAVALGPPAGTPDPKLMVLARADLGSAKVTSQGYYKDKEFPSVISYSREFEAGRVGATPVLYASSDAEIGTSDAASSTYMLTLRRLLSTKQGRAFFAKEFSSGVGDSDLISKPQVGRPRAIGVGPGAFDVLMTFRLLGVRTEAHLTVFRVERILGALVVMGVPGTRVSLSVMTRLAKVMAARMTTQALPVNTVLPTIAGTAQVAQTLTAASGTWTGLSATFTYQWQRCDAAGANCVDLPGASAQTYIVTDADVGTTLRVAVTAQNAVGRVTAGSAQTVVVVAAPPPA